MAISLDFKTLEEWGRQLVADTRASLESSGSNATGKTAESLRFEIQPNRFQFFGRAFIYSLEYGRKPTSEGASAGNPTLREALEEWIKAKGFIADSDKIKDVAWAMSIKIHKEGTLLYHTQDKHGRSKPSGIINSVINDGRLKQLGDRLILQYINQFQTEVFQ